MAEAARSSDGKAEPNHSAVIVHDRDGSSPQPRASSSGSASSPEVDPESALSVNPDPKAAGDCRICYLALDNAASESGPPSSWVVLANTIWPPPTSDAPKLGSRLKETADAASTEQMNEGDDDPAMAPAQPSSSSSDRSLWRRQCFLNLLLTFLVFLCAFSWLYHYNLPY